MRVLVTRAAEDAGATAARLRALGHEPVLAPLGTVVPLPMHWPGDPPAALAATSAHAFPGLGSVPEDVRHTPVFAVGERTAHAAREAGFRHVQAGGEGAAALSHLLSSALPTGSRVLYAAGRTRKPDLERALQAAGFAVEVVETYAVEPVPALPAAVASLLATPDAAAVLHYSRGTAERLAALCRAAGLEDALVGVRHLCLSHDVAEPLFRLGARHVLVAAAPREADLLDLLPKG